MLVVQTSDKACSRQQYELKCMHIRGVTGFKSDFESKGFCHFFTNPNPSDLQTHFLLDLDLIFVLNFRKINCFPLTV